MRRITVNLAPADLRKEGPSYDLPMAVALLAASEQLALEPAQHLFLGELGLDGALRHTTGILPMVALARERAPNSFLFMSEGGGSRSTAVTAAVCSAS